MGFGDLSNAGAAPALTQMLRFAAQRQRLIQHNIANISTPNFRMMDVSVGDFQGSLAEAVERRRERTGGMHGALEWEGTGEVRPAEDGGLVLDPQTPAGGVMYHDRNDRNMERLMQSLAENVAAYRVAADLLRNHNERLRVAISQRV